MKAIEPARRLRLIILDACRDNPFARTMRRAVASRSVGRGLGRVEPTTSDTLIAFAAKAGSTALDGDGQNSPFTAALLRHIATPGLDIRIAFGEVRDDVMDLTHRAQEPFVYGSLGGRSISLVDAPVGAGAGSLGNDPARIWEATRETGSRAVLEDFIRQFGSTPYGSMARARLEELKKLAALPPAGAVSRPADVTTDAESSTAGLRRTLSKDFAIDPDVLETVVNHPFFANAPMPRLESFAQKTTGKDSEVTAATKFRWLPHGISTRDYSYEYSSPWKLKPGGTYRSTSDTAAAYAANNFIELAEQSRSTSTVPGKKPETSTTYRSTLIKLEKLTGSLFPMTVGNKFGYSATWRPEERSLGDDTHDNSCRVVERRSGSDFHRDLGGDAYVIACDYQYFNSKDRKMTASKSTEIFFSDLGVFLSVDTIDPKQVIVSKDYRSLLTSFALAR